MKILYCNRIIAEGTNPQDNVLLISIRHPGQKVALQEGWNNILKLEFDDVTDDKIIILGGNGKEIKIVPFNQEMAKKVLDTVDNIRDNVNTIMIHCEAGISRSAAVARFLSEKYNVPIIFPKDHKNDLPNIFVYNLLRGEDNDRQEKRKTKLSGM